MNNSQISRCTDCGLIRPCKDDSCAECAPTLATDGGTDAVYLRIDGLSADDVGEEFLDLANDIFDELRTHHGDAVEGVVPVLNEDADPRILTDGGEVQAAKQDLKWAKPPQARNYHVFGDDGRSLCGKYGFFMARNASRVADDDNYSEGQDCKKCCRKAGLLEGER